MSTNDEFAAIILSAGKSTRMGTHKALLEFDEKNNYAQKIIEQFLQAGAKKCVLVVNNEIYNKL